MTNKTILTENSRYLVTIAAYAAKGDQVGLKKEIELTLAAGGKVSEIKEILVQVYAYCGFPRSLNALGTLLTVVKEKNLKFEDKELDALVNDGKSLTIGEANQTKLVGTGVKGELFTFAPEIDQYLKAHLFGDIFSRSNLSWKTRELATIAMLAAMSGTEAQLHAHIGIGKNNGVTDEEVAGILNIVKTQVNGMEQVSSFPLGQENTGYAQYFSGKSWLAPLALDKRLGIPVFNVTFEPSCRNNWHSHTGGQMLIAVGGVGYYQERGKIARRLLPGDVVEISPNVEHWHGAAPDEWFSHLAIEGNPNTNKNTWLEPVSDEDYAQATKK